MKGMSEDEIRDFKRSRDRAYYQAHKDKRCARQREYAQNNKASIAENAKAYYEANKRQVLDYHARYREANRIALREKELIRRYGIDYAEYKRLALLQGGRCAVCGKECELVIDHRHDGTCNVRGLICGKCNVGLGMFFDNPVFLQSAIDYIRASHD
jgi:hypothetical protein